MSKKEQQHYIPRTYLKYFQIDDSNNKSFVYCIDFSNKYNQKIQRKGLNDKVFKERKFYNDNRLEDVEAIEKVLSEDIEPKYGKIIKAISKEVNPKKEIIEDIMDWLFISKTRSYYLRSNIRHILNSSLKIINNYNAKKSFDNEKVINEYINSKSREIHLNLFSNQYKLDKIVNLYVSTLNAKHWRILKSLDDFPFITNDNPGFSPNLHPLFSKNIPFHSVMELNANSIIYYVLSPKYCLEISPFKKGTPLTLCALNMGIKFEKASIDLINYINKGVYHSSFKLLISNSQKVLEPFL